MEQYDRLFQRIFDKTDEMLEELTPTVWKYDENDTLPNSDEVIMGEPGFRIGGSLPGGVNYTVPTSDPSVITEDEVVLYGPDLGEVKEGAPYGRITYLQVDDTDLKEIQLFNTILDTHNSKHHVKPEGLFLDQTQAGKYEELFLTYAKQKEGVSFRQLGNSYIAEMKKNPRILHVKMIFITDPAFDFDEANRVRRSNQTYQIAMRAHSTTEHGFRG